MRQGDGQEEAKTENTNPKRKNRHKKICKKKNDKPKPKQSERRDREKIKHFSKHLKIVRKLLYLRYRRQQQKTITNANIDNSRALSSALLLSLSFSLHTDQQLEFSRTRSLARSLCLLSAARLQAVTHVNESYTRSYSLSLAYSLALS